MSATLSDMIGLTMSNVSKIGDDQIRFTSACGRSFRLYHQQDCCESVTIDDIAGDLSDLVGSPIVMAEEVSSLDGFDDAAETRRAAIDYDLVESHTWTFYKFATAKGYVTVRWFGTSNGYYSESAGFEEEKN